MRFYQFGTDGFRGDGVIQGGVKTGNSGRSRGVAWRSALVGATAMAIALAQPMGGPAQAVGFLGAEDDASTRSAVVSPRAVSTATSNGAWSSLGTGVNATGKPGVRALIVKDDTLYVGGGFDGTSGVAGTAKLAAWSLRDDTFMSMGAVTGTDFVSSLAVSTTDDTVYFGTTPPAATGNAFNAVGAWSPTTGLFTLGQGFCASFSCAGGTSYPGARPLTFSVAMPTTDDSVYFGGMFRTAYTATELRSIAAWSERDDTFTALAQGIADPTGSTIAPISGDYFGVRSLLVSPLDDDTVYVGGIFNNAEGSAVSLNGIAAWSNSSGSFHPLGAGLSFNGAGQGVFAMAAEPNDDTLYIGGLFPSASGVPGTLGLAAWSNVDDTFHSIDSPLTGTNQVNVITLDSANRLLYVGGVITGYGNAAVLDLRTMDWAPILDAGTRGVGSAPVNAIAIDDTNVYFGGGAVTPSPASNFTKAGSTNVARWTWAPPYGDFTANQVIAINNATTTSDVRGQAFIAVTGAELRPVAGGTSQSVTVNYAQSTDDTLNVTIPSGLTPGTYGLWATGIGGTSDDSIATVTVAAPPTSAPSEPQSVTGRAKNGEILVSWSPPASGLPITTYEARATKVNGGQTATCTTATTSCSITLANDDSYTLDVRAQNSIGWGGYSSPAVGPYMPSTSRPVQPLAPTLTRGDGQFSVENNPGSGIGITPYEYKVYVSGSGSPLSGSPFTFTTPGPWMITGATNGTAYVVQVEAIGESTPSNSLLSTPSSVTPIALPATPQQPTGVAGDGEVTVTVTPGSGGLTPTAFRVTASPGGATCNIIGASGGSCTITGLTNGTAYTFTAIASAGGSPALLSSPSTPSAPVTPSAPGPGPGPNPPGPGPSPDPGPSPAKPGAPGSVTAAAGSKSVTVSWAAAPAPTDGPVVLYRAVATPGGATCTASGSATSCTIEGLTDGRSYMVSVSAINAGGTGPAGMAGPVIPASVAPATPGRPRVTAGNGQVLVSVTPGSGGGTPDSYVATASPSGASCTVAVPATSCAITGLTNGTDYTVTVVAKNAAGSSTASTASAAVEPDADLPEAPATPGTPVVTSDDRSAKVTVTPGTGGGAPDTYTVSASPGTASCEVKAPATSCVVTGLTNGTAYTFTVTASNRGGVSSASAPSAPVTPAIPAPAQPASVEVLAGDGTATVVVNPGTGGGAVSFYRVAAAPGGAWCSISPPALACEVKGLDNGTAYTFTVTAYNNSGASPVSEPSNPATPEVAISPVITPLPNPLPPGDSRVTEDGAVVSGATVQPDQEGTGLEVQGPGFAMNLAGVDNQGYVIGLAGETLLLLEDGRARTDGEGFRPGSQVGLYVNPPTASSGVATRSGDAVFLGNFPVDYLGNFRATARVPSTVPAGDHVLQAVGVTGANTERAVSIGIRVLSTDMTLTLDKGKRAKAKDGDRITTTGTTSGIPAGSKLVPQIRYGKKGPFTRGLATIVVQDDGTFRWSRKIARGKDFTAYVSFANKKSNTVTWVRVR